MALTPPSQTLAVSPYDNYSSNMVNVLNRLKSYGRDCILTPKNLEVTEDTTSVSIVHVSTGMAIQSDVMVQILSDYEVYMNNEDYYVNASTGYWNEAGYYYIVLDYTYVKSKPAPTAYFKIIKPSQRVTHFTTRYQFIKCVEVVFNVPNNRFEIVDLYNYDPDYSLTDDRRSRQYAYMYFPYYEELPTFVVDDHAGMLIYDRDTELPYFGTDTGWEALIGLTELINTNNYVGKPALGPIMPHWPTTFYINDATSSLTTAIEDLDQNIHHAISQIDLDVAWSTDWKVKVDGDAVPTAEDSTGAPIGLLVCNDTLATTVTNITNPEDNQVLVVYFVNANTTIQDNANIDLNGSVDYTGQIGDSLLLQYNAYTCTWKEIARSNIGTSPQLVAIQQFIGQDNPTDATPDYSSDRIIEQNTSLETAISELDLQLGYSRNLRQQMDFDPTPTVLDSFGKVCGYIYYTDSTAVDIVNFTDSTADGQVLIFETSSSDVTLIHTAAPGDGLRLAGGEDYTLNAYENITFVYRNGSWREISRQASADDVWIRAFIGKANPGNEMPSYSSHNHFADAINLEAAIGELDESLSLSARQKTITGATPSVLDGSGISCGILVTGNLGATTITNLTNGFTGQTVIIWFGDNHTEVASNLNILLAGGVNHNFNTSETLTLVYDGSQWNEVSRKQLGGAGAVTLGLGNLDSTSVPSVAGYNSWQTDSTSVVTYTNFAGGTSGQIIYILFKGSDFIIESNEITIYLQGKADFHPDTGDTLTLMYDGIAWYEIGRSVNS